MFDLYNVTMHAFGWEACTLARERALGNEGMDDARVVLVTTQRHLSLCGPSDSRACRFCAAPAVFPKLQIKRPVKICDAFAKVFVFFV